MDEWIGNHLHLVHITNDFACLGCYKLLHEIRGANRDTYACDAVHLNDIVWAVDFCNQGAKIDRASSPSMICSTFARASSRVTFPCTRSLHFPNCMTRSASFLKVCDNWTQMWSADVRESYTKPSSAKATARAWGLRAMTLPHILEGSPPIPMHGQGRRLHRPLQRFLVPTAAGVDEGWVDGHL